MKRHLAIGAAAGLVSFAVGKVIFLTAMHPDFLASPLPEIAAARLRIQLDTILPAALAIGSAAGALSWGLTARN